MKLTFNLNIKFIPFHREWTKPCLTCFWYERFSCLHPRTKNLESKLFVCYDDLANFEKYSYELYYKKLTYKKL